MKDRIYNPVKNARLLSDRIVRFFESTEIDRISSSTNSTNAQLALDQVKIAEDFILGVPTPDEDLREFIEQVTFCLPLAEVYLFGGIIRDLALFGRKGFSSDVDLVVDGKLDGIEDFLYKHGAKKNKFGGYRLEVGRDTETKSFSKCWEVDIWEAKNTWAIKQGHVSYVDITSLLQTTITNWDSVLMDWRTKEVITSENYFDDIKELYLDIILANNPNKLGMAVRVFRYLTIKKAKKFSYEVLRYLVAVSSCYSYEQLLTAENNSYRENSISIEMYKFFSSFQEVDQSSLLEKFHELFYQTDNSLNQVISGQEELFK